MAKGDQIQPVQTTTTQLPDEAKELLGLALPGARSFAATVPQRYQGPTIAGFDPSQTAGQEAALGAAGAQAGVGQGATAAFNQLTNNPWDPNTNETLRGAVTAATRPIQEQFTNQLGQIRGEAITRGGFGGSRQGIAEGQASEGASRAVGDTANKLVTGVYDTNVNAALKAIGLAPTVQQAQVQPAITTSGVGDVRQALDQALLNQGASNYNYDMLAPFLQSKELLSLVQGIPGGTVTSTGNNPPSPSPWLQGLGGAASGAALGTAILPGIGTAAGAGIGGLLPFLLNR